MSDEGRGGRRTLRSYAEVAARDRSDLPGQIAEQHRRLRERLAQVGAVVGVVSGKGGVGKSAVTANLAVTLAARGARVGVVDADLNGPCMARMLGLARTPLADEAHGVGPAVGAGGVRGISTELLGREGDPVRLRGPAGHRYIWEGAAETAVLREFLADVAWGRLDYLLVDVPPGTDKIGRFLELIPEPHQILLVGIPSPAAQGVVARSATYLSEAGVDVVGRVCNMDGYAAEDGGALLPMFGGTGVPDAREPEFPVWARVPFAPALGARTDAGHPPGATLEGPAGRAFAALAHRVEEGPGGRERRR